MCMLHVRACLLSCNAGAMHHPEEICVRLFVLLLRRHLHLRYRRRPQRAALQQALLHVNPVKPYPMQQRQLPGRRAVAVSPSELHCVASGAQAGKCVYSDPVPESSACGTYPTEGGSGCAAGQCNGAGTCVSSLTCAVFEVFSQLLCRLLQTATR
jgi:hypothetical protein